MTDDYRELAAAEMARIELARIRDANDGLWSRAAAAREDGHPAADALEAEAVAASFRLAEDYITLAALERDVLPPAAAAGPGQE